MITYENPSVLIKGSIPISGKSTDQLFWSNPPEFFVSSNKDSINLIKGTPVTTHPSGVGFLRAAQTGMATAAYGLLAEDSMIGVAATVMLQGTLVLSDWTLLTGGSFLQAQSIYYLGTSGKLSVSAPVTPGLISQVIGRAVSPVALAVIIDSPILL